MLRIQQSLPYNWMAAAVLCLHHHSRAVYCSCLVVLLKRLYTNQEATVRTEFGETDNIDVGKGVRQGCILSPLLFNIYAENIMREALEEWESGISIGRRMVTNLRYADDTTLFAGTKEDLIELVERVRRVSEKAGLYLNVGKTKVMTT